MKKPPGCVPDVSAENIKSAGETRLFLFKHNLAHNLFILVSYFFQFENDIISARKNVKREKQLVVRKVVKRKDIKERFRHAECVMFF